ncbi:MAG: ribose 5-phosphate isomerase [Bacteroidota bacterium]
MSNETSNNGSKISIVVLVIALIGSWIYFVNTNNTKTEIITNYTAEVAVLDSTKNSIQADFIAASAKKFIILVGDDKIVSKLGSRGKLPVEVVPFGAALVKHKLHSLGIHGEIWMKNGTQGITDNGNLILDCIIPPTLDPAKLEHSIRTIPGVVDTGFFIQMADVVLVGDNNFNFIKESFRK